MRRLAIARALLVPLDPTLLLAILYFAVALSIGENAGVAGILLQLVTSSLAFCYGLALLDHVREGRKRPLVLSIDVLQTYGGRAAATFALVVAGSYIVYRLGASGHAGLAGGVRFAALLLSPAMLGVMSTTGRWHEALNPLTLADTVVRMRGGYAALVVLLGVLWAVPLLSFRRTFFSFEAMLRLETLLPTGLFRTTGWRGVLFALLVQVVVMYAWLATAAMIGRAFFEWRRELGIRAADGPERDEERAALELARERDAIMDRLYNERFGNAAASVRRMIAEAERPVDERRWLYARAAEMQDPGLASFIAQLLLPMLLARRATGEALRVTRERLRAAPDFRPRTSAELAQLVELAYAAGDRATARRLLADVERHFAGDALALALAKSHADARE